MTRKMKLSTKLFAGFGFLVLIMGGIGGYTMYGLGQINAKTYAVGGKYLPELSESTNL